MTDQVNEQPVSEETQKTENTADVTVIGVSFRDTGKTYYFDPKNHTYRPGDHVVVETARGPEYGLVTQGNKVVSSREVTSPLRPVIRLALKDDTARYERNRKIEQDAAQLFPQKAEAYHLEMKLSGVECAFDNSKLVFYFTAENRVDFRELVRDLAGVFHTRIELRQIGIRDEAKMLGGIGPCGRPFCCTTFLSDFGQVSIKMAKEQNFLNSSKISGCCGRLMCCLRFEHEAYEEARKVTPKVGAFVTTPDGPGTVIETRPLQGIAKVRLEGKQEAVKVFEVSALTRRDRPAKSDEKKDDDTPKA